MTRRAVIIGGSGQNGRAAAASLLEHGWTVVCAQRNPDDVPADLQGRGATTAPYRADGRPWREAFARGLRRPGGLSRRDVRV